MKLIKEEKLLFGLPIKIKDLGTIYQPTILDYVSNNINIQTFISIFNIKIDLLIENNKELKDFDFFILQRAQGENLMINKLMKYLKLLYKTDNVSFVDIQDKDLSTIGILIKVAENEEYFINRDNYNKLAEVVCIMLGTGNNIKEEEIKEELNEIDLKIAQRKKEFEKKKAEREAKLQKENKKNKSEITIYDLINYIIHTDNSQFDYNNILKLTIYQVKNTFSLYRMKENYSMFMEYKTSGNFKIEEDIDHWYFKKD